MNTAEFLKQNTRALHDELEQKMLVDRIFSRTLTLIDYHKISAVNLLVHRAVEPAIAAQLSDDLKTGLNIGERQKTPALLKDVGQTRENDALDFSLDNSDEALGAMYVLEGATLGGNVIRRQLAQNPEFADVDFNYYGIYGDNLAQNWKSFLQILEEHVKDQEAALTGAQKTYGLFIATAEKSVL